MIAQFLGEVLEATGYLENGTPGHGVYLEDDARSRCQAREFEPDALWRSDSALTVYFKLESEDPSTKQVERWRQEIWNQGFAPLLWVVSPDKIDLYNGFGDPRATEDAAAHRLGTFKLIASELDKLDAFAGRFAMETGHFWQQAPGINRKTCVDRQLLSDLGALERDLVDGGVERTDAQALIGRSIFTQYLIDRRIVTEKFLAENYNHSTLASILRDPISTRNLFDWLRVTFNGDIFPLDGSYVKDADHLSRVADFLQAVDPDTKQMKLFPYQFDVIPVELISSIYEQFAHAHSSKSDTDVGKDVFYTRLSLVSLVMDEIADGLTGDESVLDLTCGSGVFLVEALRKLVDLQTNGAVRNRDIIRSTLHEQIFGVEISRAAVHVAAFSLYLAALELDPDPQPPQALKFEPLIGKTLILGDARDAETTEFGKYALTENGIPKKFDVIVGNPPWSYGGKSDKALWQSKSGRFDVVAPRGTSLDFVSQAMRFASERTRFGLILSAAQFFSGSATGATATRTIIERLSPVTLVNLSNQSAWLFPRGKMPAIVLFARHRPSRKGVINTVQVPWSPTAAQSHTFALAPSDVISLRLDDWRRRPESLKAAFLGFRRDLSLLDRLISRHFTLGQQLERRGTRLRAGLKMGNRSRNSCFLHGLPLIANNDVQHFHVSIGLRTFVEERAEGPRRREIYRAPLLIVKEFLTQNPRPVVAVVDRDAVYMDAYFGVSLPSESEDVAYLLAAILSSSLASWFFLMSASTFGLWMRRLLRRDVERLPVPNIDQAVSCNAGRNIIELASNLQGSLPSVSDWQAIDEGVFDLYDLSEAERIVARDGLSRASWQWKAGREASVKPADIRHVSNYAHSFQAALGAWLSAANKRSLRAEVFDLPLQVPLRVVRFVLEECSKPNRLEIIRPEGDLRSVLDRIGERLAVPISSAIVGERELRVHGRNEVVIVKPAARRHWMEVSALEDVDSVVIEGFCGTGV